MKTFKDLEFKPHPVCPGLMARMRFENGYGVSVVRFQTPFGGGYGSYTSSEEEWELAVLKDGALCYSTPITDDVIGHLTAREVTNVMEKVQKLEMPAKYIPKGKP